MSLTNIIIEPMFYGLNINSGIIILSLSKVTF